jgi:hypothetical protein
MGAMTDRSSRAQRVRHALALRNDVLRYLASAPDDRAADRLRTATPDTWSLLLRFECTALPLGAQLRSDDTLDRLDAAVQERLASAEATELQRVLAARVLVREIDAVAVDVGACLTLLKGAAIVADVARQPLDLGDVGCVPLERAPVRRATYRRLLTGAIGSVPAESTGPGAGSDRASHSRRASRVPSAQRIVWRWWQAS